MEDRRVFWTRKFVEYGSALKGYFRRRAASGDDVEDLAQEVYLRLLRVDAGENTKILNPEAYLYTVAVNLLRERAILRKRRGQDLDVYEVTEELFSPDPGPEEHATRLERERRLSEIINALSPKFKAAIILHYAHDLSHQEIADKLGVTPHAVKKNISRGLQACRRKMSKLG